MREKKKYEILTVEDNDGDYKLVLDYLTEKIDTPIVYRAMTYAEALIQLQNCTTLDVVLLDLSLPDKSGSDLVNSIIEVCHSLPVIILTGHSDIEFSIKSISFGISDYLLKDELTPDALYKSIVYSIERNKARLELIESEQRFSDLFQQSQQPMWVYDIETYKFIQVNIAAIREYGYSEEEFLNMTIFDIKPVEEHIKMLETTLNIQSDFSNDHKGYFKHKKKSGRIIDVEIFGNPILIKGKIYRSIIAIDITEKLRSNNILTKAIIKTQEDERYEIGSELHDNICQILVGTQIHLSLLKEHLLPKGYDYFESIVKFIDLAGLEFRNLSHRLAPAFFEASTMEEYFKQLLINLKLSNDVEIKFHISEFLKNKVYVRELQLNLYRILQEQCRNIQKHAKATTINLNLELKEDYFEMSIKDNGIGFNVKEVRNGIGLANIKRRANMFGGFVVINSSPGNGCEMLISIPEEKLIKVA